MSSHPDNHCELAGTVVGEGVVRCRVRPRIEYHVRFTLQVVSGEGGVDRLLCSVEVPPRIAPSALAGELEGQRVRLVGRAVALRDDDPDRRCGVMFVAASWCYEVGGARVLPFPGPSPLPEATAPAKAARSGKMAAAGDHSLDPDEP